MLEFKKKASRRKSKKSTSDSVRKDPTYRPGQENKNPNKTAKRKRSDNPESLLRLMGVTTSPSKTAVVSSTLPDLSPFKSTRSEILDLTQCELSSPDKGPATSSLITPRKQSKLYASRRIQCDDGDVTIFISAEKAKENILPTPTVSNEWVQNFSLFSSFSLSGKMDVKITKQMIQDVNHLHAQRRRDGKHARLITQKQTTGIAASDALTHAGIAVEPKEAHWIHFIPSEFLGDEGQTTDNLGIGLKYSNGAMEMVNRVVREILFDKTAAPEALYLSAIPIWKKGYENIRLLESLTYIVKSSLANDAKSFTLSFNMLDRAPICPTDIEPIAKVLKNKFLIKSTNHFASRALLFSYSSPVKSSSSTSSLTLPDENSSDDSNNILSYDDLTSDLGSPPAKKFHF